MSRTMLLLLVVALIGLSFAPQVAAFGAGNIPSFSYLEEKAYRHGDIEDIIANIMKATSSGLFGRGVKFTPLDVKRVYFGNWLRDYSQAVDVGALKKTNLQSILTICMVLGFMAHGYVTGEFEVTEERLGAYLPTEHIDNPKGYAEGEDARKYDRRLRGPVDPRELHVDHRTGMKNYIANEHQGWSTSKALIRDRLNQCIQLGRQFRSSDNKADAYEAFRLLGTALHTLEDFTAHSNWCELALISFGYNNVFPHVGRNVLVQSPRGKSVHPLITGTFGGADFIHSLMGEATDHLSQASVSDLTKTVANARSTSEAQSISTTTLRTMFFDLPGSDSGDLSRDMDGISNMRAGLPGGMDPTQMSPQELHATIWKILSWRDSIMKRIENGIDRIPGLSGLIEKITNSISVFVITTLEPFVKPLIGTATTALGQSSQEVINSHDQFEVWNDWNASDPTHSFLSKDHFGLILNQPAGEIAQVVVEYAVNLVVKAWEQPGMPTQQVTEPILEALFHPDFHDGHSQIQTMMLDKMRSWIDHTGHNKQEILNRLSADMVRQGKNKRIGAENADSAHVHNAMLPQGGLQQVLNQHNVSLGPGANVLNASQDLLEGKMPWQQGFGSGTAGGQHAWRDINQEHPNSIPPSLATLEPPYGTNQPGYQAQSQPDFNPYQSQPDYAQPAYQPQSDYSQSNYQPPQPSYGHQSSYDPPANNGYPGQGHHQSHGYDQGGYGGPPPPPPHFGGPPPDQYGGPPPGQYGGPPPGQYGGPPPEQWTQQGGYNNGPPPPGPWGPPPNQYGPPSDQYGGSGGWR